MINFQILSKDEVSEAFLKLGVNDFQSASRYIAHLPYRRNRDKNDLLCVFKDQGGTCSTKHAVLRKWALENGWESVRLILGVFKMDAAYAPKIANTLEAYGLDYIPEAHNYLKTGEDYYDFTHPHSRYSDFQERLIEEFEIEFSDITTIKVELHKNFLKHWIENDRRFTLDEIWAIREQCIADLQK